MYGWTQNRGCFTAVILLMATTSAGIVVFGDDSQRVLGIAAFAMFGGGGAAWLVGEYLTKRAGAPRSSWVELPDGSTIQAWIVPIREGKLRAAVVAQAAFAIGSFVFALHPDALGPGDTLQRWFMGAMGVLLVISVVYSARGWREKRTFVALSPAGFHVRGIGSGSFIPWTGIVGVSRTDMYGQPQLSIRMIDRDAAIRSGGRASLPPRSRR
jgi:hypothetical protein